MARKKKVRYQMSELYLRVCCICLLKIDTGFTKIKTNYNSALIEMDKTLPKEKV